MEKCSDLGKKIRIARLLRGLSQENVAFELGIKQQTYQLIENGTTHITEIRFEKISKILGVEKEFIEMLDNIDLLNHIIKDYFKVRRNTLN
jgi:transcriptional regulator with XRE-family HTH domain